MRFIKTIDKIRLLLTLAIIATLGLMGFSLTNYDDRIEGDLDPKSSDVVSNIVPIIEHPYRILFEENCSRCHRIESKLVGPALAGINDRRTDDWIVSIVRNSTKLIESGDKTANALYKEYRKMQMPNFDYLSEEQILGIVEYIKAVSN